ncbi:MAG TPA: DUF3568 family protein [Candidatus Omnitrophota bacterium]|nr:DUF3568 family protein [Candidatus Omnitrophota bacterium]HPD85514.1 DUF3568 family protein [Candidatus Omnitrophota bacterium]HRZ04446.1 DUF3568 family protein [Candidatus Omnitrophota bacterium]
MIRAVKKYFFVYLSFVVLIFSMGGCVAALIGGAAVGGAIVVSQDFATTSIDTSFQRAWAVANDQLKKFGTIDKSFQKIGEIRATVEGSTVQIKISRLTDRTVDIKVSARKNMLPNTQLAESILASIIRKL